MVHNDVEALVPGAATRRWPQSGLRAEMRGWGAPRCALQAPAPPPGAPAAAAPTPRAATAARHWGGDSGGTVPLPLLRCCRRPCCAVPPCQDLGRLDARGSAAAQPSRWQCTGSRVALCTAAADTHHSLPTSVNGLVFRLSGRAPCVRQGVDKGRRVGSTADSVTWPRRHGNRKSRERRIAAGGGWGRRGAGGPRREACQFVYIRA